MLDQIDPGSLKTALGRVLVGGAVALAIAASGCGGDDGDEDTQAATTATTSDASATLADAEGKELDAEVQVRRVSPGRSVTRQPDFADETAASDGDTVQVRVESSDERPPADARLAVTIEGGPADELEVTVGGYEAPPADRARIASRGDALTASLVSYTCVIGDERLCPPDLAERTEQQYRVVTKPPPRRGAFVFSVRLRGA